MIFSPKIYEPKDIIKMILTGEKCQTRRLVKEGQSFVTTTDKKSLKEYNFGSLILR